MLDSGLIKTQSESLHQLKLAEGEITGGRSMVECWWWEIDTGLVSSKIILTSWGEDVSLALVGQPPPSDVVTIKMPYWVDVFLQ